MSYLNKLFGGNDKKKKETPPIGTALEKLRNIEGLLTKKQEFLEKKIQVEMGNIKKNGVVNKRYALQALKRKKRYEQQLKIVDGTLATIEMQREALEGAKTNTAVFETMKTAADVLKESQKNMDVDKVHDILEDIAEQQEVSLEISQAISNPIGLGEAFDEDELEKELEELEQEDLDKELMSIGLPPSSLPSTPGPSHPPVAIVKAVRTTEEEEEELQKLEQWAS